MEIKFDGEIGMYLHTVIPPTLTLLFPPPRRVRLRRIEPGIY